ncbi:MAG: ribonuclease Z [Syntrophobacteraceae bacterium]
MKVKFLGVGEAFDEMLPNTSIWVRVEGKPGGHISVLLDCGFTAPPPFWQSCPDPDDLDAIWISHFHGDHFFGIPALLVRLWESGRKRPLLFVGQEGIESVVCQATRLAYASIMDRFTFELKFIEVEPGERIEAAGLSWQAARSGHPQKDLAVRIEGGGKSVFYSGDGPPTDETLALARGCGLAIHEAFRLDRDIPGHGSILGAIDFARKAKARSLALVHIQRDERRERREEILKAISAVKEVRVFMPEPGEEVEIR